MAVQPIPDGYHTYTPYYVVDGAADFITFLANAFGAEEKFRMPMPGGKLGHAEVKIGDSVIMLADGNAEHPPRHISAMLYVKDCDAVFAAARSALASGPRVSSPRVRLVSRANRAGRDEPSRR